MSRARGFAEPPASLLRARRPDGSVRALAEVDPGGRPGLELSKADGERLRRERAQRLADLQELLYANGRTDPESAPSVLVVVQGMDTAGKGGVMRTVAGAMDPQGVDCVAFGAPTEEEREHDFLWRVARRLPAPGRIALFDRSHYEDVLIHRVEGLSAPEEIERRYGAIARFEADAVAAGTRIVKVMLHIGADEQRDRLLSRLERPEKHWKFDPADLEARARWDEYQQAYDVAIERTDTDDAPWFIVPADRKWYSRLAVQELLIDVLERLELGWPTADFDVEAARRRLASEG